MFKILQDRVYGLESKQKLYNAAKGKYECYSAILYVISWNVKSPFHSVSIFVTENRISRFLEILNFDL